MSVALLIQRAMCIRRSVLSSVAVWLDHIFPRYVINGTIFGEKKLLNMKCVL